MKTEKQLYQWDVNQYLTELQPTAEFIDYPMGNEVIRLETDGTRCRIPDEVLQTYGGKTCYERYPDGTFRAYSFTVLYAPKPPNYVFTPEERTTFEALTARVDAAIDEIKRRADSGEFTPVKGVDYFTEAEKAEMMEGVSSGAVGEFRNVVDSATTEYNDNHNSKLAKYNANASEKLTTYDVNAEQHTTDYNRNAAEKLEAYNQNNTAKVAEYNQNAETKTAEFDANAAALQTEVAAFEAREVAAREAFEKSETEARGQFETSVGEQIAEKANIDGYYEEMTVGDAEQLISSMYSENSEPYGYRTTGGSADVGNREYVDAIVGGTVAWNQQLKLDTAKNDNGITASLNNDGSVTINGTATSDAYILIDSRGSFKLDENHKYLYKGCPSGGSGTRYFLGDGWSNMGRDYGKGTIFTATSGTFQPSIVVREGNTVSNLTFKPNLIDLTQMFGSTIADYIYSLEQSQAGAGVAWFKKLFTKDYYPYNAGELLSVEGLQSHDTVGFNAFDIATNKAKLLGGYQYEIVGAYTSVSYEDASGNVETLTITNRLFTPTNNGILTVVGADSTTCVHLVWLGYRNGEYEPYEKHSYPLDSSLTLRGIPKLDASNNLYYDGDEYTSDGKVTRKYGVVDLGTLDYTYITSDNIPRFRATPSGIKEGCQVVSSMYVYTGQSFSTLTSDKTVANFGPKSNRLEFRNDSYTDATAFKAAMSGVMLVYELATPTTETAEPFHNIQIVDDFGTEEFVSTGIVPVGHKTRYPANLRDKLQHLPDLASGDGTYLIQQSGKQMSLVHMPAVFPDTPTEDGTYTLKTVVTGGVATLQWVVE